LRYGVLTVGGFLHRLLELLAPSLDLLERHLQASNLFLGVLKGGVELLFTVAEAYEIPQLVYYKKTSLDKIINMTIRPTNGKSIELRSSLRALRFSSASSSSILLFSAAATSRTCLSS
jgi:hypothetical protein